MWMSFMKMLHYSRLYSRTWFLVPSWSWLHMSSTSGCICLSASCHLVLVFSVSISLSSSNCTHTGFPDQAARCRGLRPCGSKIRGDAPPFRSSETTSELPERAAKWQAVFRTGPQVAFALAPRSRQLCVWYKFIALCMIYFSYSISGRPLPL